MPTQRHCRVCDCWELQACPGGCSWIELDLCSTCHKAALGGPTPPATAARIEHAAFDFVCHLKLAKGGYSYTYRCVPYPELYIYKFGERGKPGEASVQVGELETPWGDWTTAAELINARREAA